MSCELPVTGGSTTLVVVGAMFVVVGIATLRFARYRARLVVTLGLLALTLSIVGINHGPADAATPCVTTTTTISDVGAEGANQSTTTTTAPTTTTPEPATTTTTIAATTTTTVVPLLRGTITGILTATGNQVVEAPGNYDHRLTSNLLDGVVAAWTVNLQGAGDDLMFDTADDTSGTTLTDIDGGYTFTDLLYGPYRVWPASLGGAQAWTWNVPGESGTLAMPAWSVPVADVDLDEPSISADLHETRGIGSGSVTST